MTGPTVTPPWSEEIVLPVLLGEARKTYGVATIAGAVADVDAAITDRVGAAAVAQARVVVAGLIELGHRPPQHGSGQPPEGLP